VGYEWVVDLQRRYETHLWVPLLRNSLVKLRDFIVEQLVRDLQLCERMRDVRYRSDTKKIRLLLELFDCAPQQPFEPRVRLELRNLGIPSHPSGKRSVDVREVNIIHFLDILSVQGKHAVHILAALHCGDCV